MRVCQVLSREGKPLMLADTKSEAPSIAMLPSLASDEELRDATSLISTSASFLLAYTSSLMALPEGPFPSMLAANKAQTAVDLFYLLSGHPIPNPCPTHHTQMLTTALTLSLPRTRT